MPMTTSRLQNISGNSSQDVKGKDFSVQPTGIFSLPPPPSLIAGRTKKCFSSAVNVYSGPERVRCVQKEKCVGLVHPSF